MYILACRQAYALADSPVGLAACFLDHDHFGPIVWRCLKLERIFI